MSLYIGTADRAQLEALRANRKAPGKIVWRAKIVLATADGCRTGEIMRGAQTSKPTVRRWQERFLDEGVVGRRFVLFKARPILREVREGVEGCSSHCTRRRRQCR
ncbi:MAG: hypothetical protein NTX73_17195 [Rhodobacterales bacterium]|jgi:hypothetical protein|nr:hypothetical protein [Rhodobacterales bacterium]